MAFEFHSNKPKYFQYQKENSKEFIHPFVFDVIDSNAKLNVLEIGCAEGGVLLSFLERGDKGVGIELMETRLNTAKDFLKEYIDSGQANLIAKNIYDIDPENDLGFKFDLIILKDVIEHIHDQKKLIGWLKEFLTENGQIFFGFPPWQMPYGGHQQMAKSKFLSKLPYYHLLPKPLYKTMLKLFGETPKKVENLLEIKDTGISLERFEKIVKETGFEITNKKLFLINPIYKYKFNLKPRKQFKLLGNIPYARNFLTTCGYYLIKVK